MLYCMLYPYRIQLLILFLCADVLSSFLLLSSSFFFFLKKKILLLSEKKNCNLVKGKGPAQDNRQQAKLKEKPCCIQGEEELHKAL